LSRLNPLHELTHPLENLELSMGRLEKAIGGLHADMAPVQELPEINATLKRMEKLIERLVAAVEADSGVVKQQPPKSRRAAQRGRAA
jgi:hypothetical protein